jgi:hypothetical protein
LATPTERDRDVATMIRAVLAFFDRYPGGGVLLYNDARVILLWTDNDVAFDTEWNKWTTDLPGLSTLVARHAIRSLPQPLL